MQYNSTVIGSCKITLWLSCRLIPHLRFMKTNSTVVSSCIRAESCLPHLFRCLLLRVEQLRLDKAKPSMPPYSTFILLSTLSKTVLLQGLAFVNHVYNCDPRSRLKNFQNASFLFPTFREVYLVSVKYINIYCFRLSVKYLVFNFP